MNTAREGIHSAGALVRRRRARIAGVIPRTKRDFTYRRLLALADVIAVTFAFAVAILEFGVRYYTIDPLGRVLWSLPALPVWILVFKIYGLYDRDAKRVSHSTIDELPALFHGVLISGLALWAYFRVLPYFVPTVWIAFREGVAFSAIALPSIFLARAAARWLARVLVAPEHVLFLGGGPMARLLIQKIGQHPEYRLEPIGYVDTAASTETLDELPYLGDVSQVEAISEGVGVDRVVVLAPAVDADALVDLIRRMKELDVKVSILPHVVDVLGPSVEIDNVEGVTVLGLNPPALTRSSRFLKRAMDVAVSATILAVTLPVMLVAALAIKLDSRGPVLYTQARIGREGRRFRIFKLRTMVRDAESRAHALKTLSAHPAWLLLDHDPRITRVGRLLRRTSLDELPQLWNVLRGNMSLVGPRPMTPDVDERIFGWGRRRLDLTPGITGLWQVLGRTNIPFEEMVKLDYLYVTNWSMWQDIRLLFSTFPAVARRRGAN